MKNNKTPFFVVVVVLLLLIIVPIVALNILKESSASDESYQDTERKEVVVDFELRQLAEKAEQLVNQDMTVALRRGDVPIDFVSALRHDLRKADKKLSGGKINEARSDYADIVSIAEAKLKTLEFAESARELKDSSYAKLRSHEHLKRAFENTYNEAVDIYNRGLRELEVGDFEASIGRFKTTNEMLDELKAQSVVQVAAQLVAAEIAIAELNPMAARVALERLLEIDPSNPIAEEAMVRVSALEALEGTMKSVKSLRSFGEDEAALAEINALFEKNPGNALLLDERKDIEADIAEKKREAILERADAAEVEGDLTTAIAALVQANEIRSDEETTKRLNQLKAKKQERRLEVLLETGYNALKAGNYEAAKKAYEAAIVLNPKSEEAKAGLKKTSSLYLANIRYNQSIESAANYLNEGRIPLATQLFNEAIQSRPSNLTFKQKDEESRIRDALEAQKEPVSVTIVSDNKTYVSLIGVFSPERLKKKALTLYPDIYKIKGTRSGYEPVEVEVKVDKDMAPGAIEVICTDK